MSSAAKGTFAPLAPLVAGVGLRWPVALAVSAKKSLCVCVLLFCSVLEYTAGISLLILLRSSNNPPPFLLTKVITGAEWWVAPPRFLFLFPTNSINCCCCCCCCAACKATYRSQVSSRFKCSDSRTLVQNECWPKTLVMSCRRY